MKHLLKLMTVALLAVACAGKDYTVAEKPVLTADMYSVKAETKTGKVVFAFLKNDLSPFWSVTDPSGIRETFNQREVTRTFKSNGVYKGTLIAYGQAGQCNPVSFEFTIDTPIPEDSEVVKAKKALSGKTFKVGRYGWWGDGWEYFGDPVPEYTADDKITFAADGTLVIDLGETARIYNDGVSGGEEYTVSGTPKWAVTKVGEAILLVFSDGGFPLMLGGNGKVAADHPEFHQGLNARWTVVSVEEGVVRLDIEQAFIEQWFTVFLSPLEQ